MPRREGRPDSASAIRDERRQRAGSAAAEVRAELRRSRARIGDAAAGAGTAVARRLRPRSAGRGPHGRLCDSHRDRRDRVVFGFLGGLVNLVTDLMWYDALGVTDVLTTRLWSQVALFASASWPSHCRRSRASGWLAASRPQVPMRRHRHARAAGRQRCGDAGDGLAWCCCWHSSRRAAWSSSWETVLLFINGGSFGSADPNFGHDIGFYIFDLPVWRFLQGWGVARSGSDDPAHRRDLRRRARCAGSCA